MEDFAYARPDSITEACTLLEEHDEAVILAGGQSLIPMLRLRAMQPEFLVDITNLPNVDYVNLEDDQIRVGCLARHADVASTDSVRERCEVLADVAAGIGDREVRNRGTICGSVAHADPAGDPPVLASLLDAEIVVETSGGTEVHNGATFYKGMYETEMASAGLVKEVRFPVIDRPQGAAYEKYEHSEGAYPVATVGAYVSMDDGTVEEAKVVTGAIETGPTDMSEIASELEGEQPVDNVFTDIAEQIGEEANPIGDAEGSADFKSEITKTLTKRALKTAVDRAGGHA